MDDLNDVDFNAISKILKKFYDVVYVKGDEWKGTKILQHRIQLTTNKVISVKRHKTP